MVSKSIAAGKEGRGGFGAVYRARDRMLNVERAVKVLHALVYDLGKEGGSVYLAMRLIAGGSLKERLAGRWMLFQWRHRAHFSQWFTDPTSARGE